MADVDLDAARAARREKENGSKSRSIVFCGRRFPAPAELPIDIWEGLARSDNDVIYRGLKAALGEHWDEFCSLGATSNDLAALAVGLIENEEAGTAGESSASGARSSKTSKRSRRTSSASIVSTSRSASGAKTGSGSGASAT